MKVDVCGACGGPLIARAADTSDALRVRLNADYEKTKPILELFSRKALTVTVNGDQSASKVPAKIRDLLGLDVQQPVG